MKPLTIATSLMIALTFTAPVQADHGCNGEIITIETPLAIVYVDDRSGGPGEFNPWLYVESNGIDGLQSGGYYTPIDDTWHPFYWSDWCAHPDPDTLII